MTSSSSFYKLKSLEVFSCDKLESVIPDAMFHRLLNLEYLHISKCSSLRNAFPPCIARDLIRLKLMNIEWCGMMREIIGGVEQKQEEEITNGDDVNSIIVFPELTKLELVDLKILTSFWCYQSEGSDIYKVKFPKLVDFEVSYCGEINLEAIDLGADDSTCQLKSLHINFYSHYAYMELPCKWKIQLYNLESLTLYGCWWREHKFLCFPKLKRLEIKAYRTHSALFTVSGFRSLQQLQTLEISECRSLEKIVADVQGDEDAGMDIQTITLLQLHSVVFRDLRSLNSFIHGANYECYMPALKKVVVDDCGLPSLFTCSVFRNLQQLDCLNVSNCRILKGIVEDVREDETSDPKDKIITLFELTSVTLSNLPRLKSFSGTVSYVFNMPKLTNFNLFECYKPENFTHSKTSTGLVSVLTDWGYEGKFTDLNECVREYHIAKQSTDFLWSLKTKFRRFSLPQHPHSSNSEHQS